MNESYEQGKRDGWEACEAAHGIVDGVHRQLDECQARDKMLREALEVIARLVNEPLYRNSIGNRLAIDALALLSDASALDAMLKQARREALIEAATVVANMNGYNVEDISSDIRYMAEELK
jgi:hypothetical protein